MRANPEHSYDHYSDCDEPEAPPSDPEMEQLAAIIERLKEQRAALVEACEGLLRYLGKIGYDEDRLDVQAARATLAAAEADGGAA